MDKTGKIVFLCKRNIIRSYFAEIIFSDLYPDFEFESAGVISPDSKIDLAWRSNLLANLGFKDPARNPKSFESIKHDLVEGDIIILLDSDLTGMLSSFITLNPKIKVLGAVNRLPDWAFTFDPFNMNSSDIKLAVARVIFTVHNLLWDRLNLPVSKSSTVFWESNKNFLHEIDAYCKREVSNGNSVVALKPIPLSYISSSISHVRLFDISDVQIPASASPVIWIPRFEHPFMDQLLLSKTWITIFRQTTALSTFKVIAGGLMHDGKYLYYPLLAGLITHKFEVRARLSETLEVAKQ